MVNLLVVADEAMGKLLHRVNLAAVDDERKMLLDCERSPNDAVRMMAGR